MKSAQVRLIDEIVAIQIVAEKMSSWYLDFVVPYSLHAICLRFLFENYRFWRLLHRDPFRRFCCARIVADFCHFGVGAEIVDRWKIRK